MRVVPTLEGRVATLAFQVDGAPASWSAVATALATDAASRYALTAALAALPFDAVAFETNASSGALPDRLVEAVAVDHPALAGTDAHPGDFAGPFARDPGALVTVFPNLSGDAVLVAPQPRGPRGVYGHLAVFLRGAPPEQVDALWAAVGGALQARWRDRPAPVWLSTAGLGVPWLHVRLDDRPKYYRTRRLTAPP